MVGNERNWKIYVQSRKVEAAKTMVGKKEVIERRREGDNVYGWLNSVIVKAIFPSSDLNYFN